MFTHTLWRQHGSQWERPPSSMETVHNSMSVGLRDGDAAHWIIACGLQFTFRGTDDEDRLTARLQRAWAELRSRFPTLAATFEEDKVVYKPPLSDEEREAWVQETFRVHPGRNSNEVFEKAVKTPYIHLHYFPEARYLVLQGTHNHLDGRGCFYFFDALFCALTNPKDVRLGDEVRNLPPTEDQLLGASVPPSTRQIQIYQDIVDSLVVENPIGMPVRADGPPGPNLRRELHLQPGVSSAISSRCKARGVTVTLAWHAAVILATLKIQRRALGDQAGTNWSSFTNFDLRRYFPGDFDPRQNVVSTYSTGFPFNVERPMELGFDALAKHLHHAYQTALDDEKLRGLFAYPKPLLEFFAKHTAPSSTPVLSSIGIVERFLHREYGSEWVVDDVWIGNSMLSPEIETFLWRWRDEITLSGSCNLSYYDKKDVDRFLHEVRQELLTGLGISV
ncbi:hypothetical protein VTK73DRAFT_2894 [Phialemonium thermophilum]|uniref:Condensation domain-containing protein n=1 Tax=Phialemonium thermophilum TaxID=223376 RepID=A0ABR3X200_9PEZI